MTVQPLDGALRGYDAGGAPADLSEMLPRESRGFQMAFQLALLEARETVEAHRQAAAPSSPEAAELIRIGLLNYIAGGAADALCAVRRAARELRHDVEALAARFGVSFEQACHRLSHPAAARARAACRSSSCASIRRAMSASASPPPAFPFARFGGSCPRWVVHTAFATPGRVRVQVAQLPDGRPSYASPAPSPAARRRWGDPPPVRVVAMGCDIAHAPDVVYADGLDLETAAVGIGLSCRLCDRPDCRSRAFPPLEHRLSLDPQTTSASPFGSRQRNSGGAI